MQKSASRNLVRSFIGACALVALAGAHADGFLGDPLRTTSDLDKGIAGVNDPLGRSCAMPPNALTLGSAVDVALCRNPATRSAWAVARAQAAAVGQAEGAWLPSVVINGSETRAIGTHVDAYGNTVSNPQNTGDAALQLSWTLYDFGLRGARIDSARRLLDAASSSADAAAQQTVLSVVQAYYGAQAADENVAAAKVTEDAYRQGYEVAKGRREGGMATLADVLQAETAYDGALLARVQAEAAAKTARSLLAVTLGVTADQGFALAPDPVPNEAPALKARLADLMAEAANQRPDLAAARAQVESAKADVDAARATGRPTIALSAGRSFVDNQGYPRQNYNTVGVTVTIPVFTGFSTTYSVRQAEATLASREITAEQLRLSVTQDVWNGYYNLQSANEQLSGTTLLLKSATENEKVALGRYQAGVGTILDLLTAQAAAATARQQRVGAELGWQVSRTQLALALGRLSGTQPLVGRNTP